ncbi:hypothetical protein [Shewanella seohaensis]|uniref:Lipoprotein n=1 Tax=Shewanella seohaensis TaxID=755175 RepID=A0ABV4VUZ2_9GAMM
MKTQYLSILLISIGILLGGCGSEADAGTVKPALQKVAYVVAGVAQNVGDVWTVGEAALSAPQELAKRINIGLSLYAAFGPSIKEHNGKAILDQAPYDRGLRPPVIYNTNGIKALTGVELPCARVIEDWGDGSNIITCLDSKDNDIGRLVVDGQWGKIWASIEGAQIVQDFQFVTDIEWVADTLEDHSQVVFTVDLGGIILTGDEIPQVSELYGRIINLKDGQQTEKFDEKFEFQKT